MSLENTYTARLRARAATVTSLVQRALERAEAWHLEPSELVGARLCSADLTQLAAAQDIDAALAAAPLARAAVEAAQEGALIPSSTAITSRAAIAATAAQLAIEERQLVTSVAERALVGLGFATRRHDGLRSSGLSAVRADHSEVLVLVHDGGFVQTDIQGCAGNSCVPLQQELEAAMDDEGLLLERRSADVHGRDDGGALILRAGKATDNGRLEVGVVRQHEHGVPRLTRSTDQRLEQRRSSSKRIREGRR
jgi:hypothetical protein